jgi:hypothetical protein
MGGAGEDDASAVEEVEEVPLVGSDAGGGATTGTASAISDKASLTLRASGDAGIDRFGLLPTAAKVAARDNAGLANWATPRARITSVVANNARSRRTSSRLPARHTRAPDR